MKKLSRRTLLMLLAYLVSAIGLTIVVLYKQSKHPVTAPQEKEEIKFSNKLGPNELFYIDRNYPEAEVNGDLFHQRLQLSMDYDRAAESPNRGLDYPWTIEGPGNIGGRVNAIAVHPFDPQVILLGYSQGGIYRTDDGGENWNPVFDNQASLSIGHISFNPHDPSKVWATTGDVNISGYPFIGAGVYRSEDAGQTWAYAGLDDKGVLSKVVIDPNDADIIYVGSMGYPSQKGNERGLFRSTDGGASWQKTLTIDDSTGVIDVVIDPFKPGRVFASGWTRIRSSIITTTLGTGTGLFRSEDFGATWTNVTNGLPSEEHSRTGIEITNDGTLFISYIGKVTEGECGGYIESLKSIFKSMDGGISWDSVPTAQVHGLPCDLFGQFGWYFEVLKVNPENALDMFLMGVDLYRTLDGGLSWFEAAPVWWTYEVHADKHDLVFAHGEIFLGTDGGAYKTDISQTNPWIDIENVPATQFYRTTWNPHAPDLYYGGAQDNGTTSGNNSLLNEWKRIYGGDGFQPLFDPTEPSWMYGLTQNGSIYFTEDDGFDFDGLNRGLQGARYWDMPFVMSEQDPKILFCGSYKMFKIDMRDSLREWKEISPDLTRGDTILGNRYPCITSIAQSGLDQSRIYAGTQDGLLWTTADGGLNWMNISEGTPGFFVTSITCSSIHPEGVFATYSGYRDNDHQPYIYRSDNAGATWEPIASDLPMMGVNSFFILSGWNDAVLFAATDGGVYVSQDAGEKWDRIGSNIPYMPVYDLDWNPVTNKLVAATFARGIMTFPIEELDLVSSTHELKRDHLLSIGVYPTLVNDYFTVDFSAYEHIGNEVSIRLIHSNGCVASQFEYRNDVEKRKRMQLQKGLAPGLYIVEIKTQFGMALSKIIVTD